MQQSHTKMLVFMFMALTNVFFNIRDNNKNGVFKAISLMELRTPDYEKTKKTRPLGKWSYGRKTQTSIEPSLLGQLRHTQCTANYKISIVGSLRLPCSVYPFPL